MRTPYLFSGRSPLGLDCGRLMTNVCERVSLPIARDAWQQAIAGDLTATSWDRTGMEPGDQVFFMDSSGKIYHTGIAISDHPCCTQPRPVCRSATSRKGIDCLTPRLNRDFFVAKRP
ncbi:MAG: NlpC/P60 family protein [Phycisphaerae bacterium]